MPSARHLSILLFAGLFVWALVTWPLPRHFAGAVPVADRAAPGAPRVVGTVAGDHMQLLYHFWLARDAFAGSTPAFSNPYEFNSKAGDTPERRFQTYYLPFSAVYAAVSPILGHAAGWNAAGLFSILLGLLGAFLLARRLASSDAAALAATLAFAALPYRWTSLISGSPTGFAMCFVPWLAYGIDRLVRDASPGGAAIAGLALLLSFCSDLHVFFFSMLAVPLLAIFSASLDGFAVLGRLRRTLVAAVPLIILAAVAVVLSKVASAQLGKSTMAEGRSMRELLLFSPVLRGIFLRRRLDGATNSIFLGFATAIFMPLCLAFLAADARKRPWRLFAALILAAASLAALLLAAGAYGPFDALPIRIARAAIPKYSMIRQPAKIFCLLPTLFTAIAALAIGRRDGGAAPGATMPATRAMPAAIAAIFAFAVFAEQASWFSTVLSRLDRTIPAYGEAAEIARREHGADTSPMALAIPLWPGDSHFSSIYELGIMSSRLRLLNGYSPSPPADYFDKLFKPLESLNQGEMDYAQYSFLESLGVEFILFHEDVFPDKVSPFPAGVSLAELASNPGLELLSSSGRVSLLRLRGGVPEDDFAKAADAHPSPGPTLADFPPAMVWSGHRIARSLETASAPGRINLALRAPAAMRPDIRYLLFQPDVGWRQLPFTNPMGRECGLPEGMDAPTLAMLVAGDDPPGEFLVNPARLFHCGTSHFDASGRGTVSFEANGLQTGPQCVMEGPFVPLPPGRWRVSVAGIFPHGCGATLQAIAGIRGGEAEVLGEAPFTAEGISGSPLMNSMCNGYADIEFGVSATSRPFAIRITARPCQGFSIAAIRLARQ